MDKVCVFTDGSALNNNSNDTRFGGMGVFFSKDDTRNISKILSGEKITNNVAELSAMILAIESIIKSNDTRQIYIYSDSMYCIKCITEYAKDWEKNDWKKKIENLRLIKKLYTLSKLNNVVFKHVNSHIPEPEDKNSEEWFKWYGNKEADKLAKMAAKQAQKKNVSQVAVA